MGSPLSPIFSNLYMEKFERKTLDSYPLKPKMWKRYAYDANVNQWKNGKGELIKFIENLNRIYEEIKFKMELEDNN